VNVSRTMVAAASLVDAGHQRGGVAQRYVTRYAGPGQHNDGSAGRVSLMVTDRRLSDFGSMPLVTVTSTWGFGFRAFTCRTASARASDGVAKTMN